MNPKETERLLAAVESIATSLGAIHGELKSLSNSRMAAASGREKVYAKLMASDPGITRIDEKEAAEKLKTSSKTIRSHAEKHGIDPKAIGDADLEIIKISMKAAKQRPHLTVTKGAKWSKPVGRKKVS